MLRTPSTLRSLCLSAPVVAALLFATVATRTADLPLAADERDPGGSALDGEKLFLTNCMACHQATGAGIPPIFPPLDGSEWVTGDKGRLIRIVLHGMQGPVEVKGTTYNSVMPPWGPVLSDADVSAILTYVRSSWTNAADAVTTAEVAAVRAATSQRKQPWTAEELASKSNLGIPD